VHEYYEQAFGDDPHKNVTEVTTVPVDDGEVEEITK
jgi:hypothetical protein